MSVAPQVLWTCCSYWQSKHEQALFWLTVTGQCSFILWFNSYLKINLCPYANTNARSRFWLPLTNGWAYSPNLSNGTNSDINNVSEFSFLQQTHLPLTVLCSSQHAWRRLDRRCAWYQSSQVRHQFGRAKNCVRWRLALMRSSLSAELYSVAASSYILCMRLRHRIQSGITWHFGVAFEDALKC
jgi:hypothetical protein